MAPTRFKRRRQFVPLDVHWATSHSFDRLNSTTTGWTTEFSPPRSLGEQSTLPSALCDPVPSHKRLSTSCLLIVLICMHAIGCAPLPVRSDSADFSFSFHCPLRQQTHQLQSRTRSRKSLPVIVTWTVAFSSGPALTIMRPTSSPYAAAFSGALTLRPHHTCCADRLVLGRRLQLGRWLPSLWHAGQPCTSRTNDSRHATSGPPRRDVPLFWS